MASQSWRNRRAPPPHFSRFQSSPRIEQTVAMPRRRGIQANSEGPSAWNWTTSTGRRITSRVETREWLKVSPCFVRNAGRKTGVMPR